MRVYATDEPDVVSSKAPTCLLLDKDKCCIEFGNEALNRALCALDDGWSKETVYCFENFKMKLQGYKGGDRSSGGDCLREPTVAPTIGPSGDGLRVPVRLLLQQAYFRNMEQALERALNSNLAVRSNSDPIVEVTFVITVPAEWSDPARDLVRSAAADAAEDAVGKTLPDQDPRINVLMLAEPEAACQSATVEDPVSIWETIMTVDGGGGTFDMTIHSIGKTLTPHP